MKYGPREPRIPFKADTFVGFGARQVHCRAGDVSNSGMLVFSADPLPNGHMAHLRFRLTGTETWIEADAVVVRRASEHARPAAGLHFLHLAETSAEKLRRYINLAINERLASTVDRPAVEERPPRSPRPATRPTPTVERTDARDWLKDVTPTAIDVPLADRFGHDDPTPVRELYRAAIADLKRKKRR